MLWSSFFYESDVSDRAVADYRSFMNPETNTYILEIDLPGVKKKDVAVKLNSEKLSIKWTRGTRVWFKEFKVQPGQLQDGQAKLEDGVLRIEFKLSADYTEKTIEVQ